MDYTQQGFCDLKENSEKIVSPMIPINLQNNMFTQ